ncbi:exodeoxyribonuclease VII small subunit [Prochlorococcus marinus]|uniref:Exodeoxyribonuclease 7 small subunit n=1 Tax=Prochlorococcus marinus (strain MIT 9211) TaxID=93059 RepID=A9BCU9_PROM4|nr:exodeoxyribonuclease VII small subunit [Prochlorococcus marinus]ABX08037.1 Exodeoxyribonuclease VII [Prochlorococcus marinus str. MIT 9211]
MKNLDSSNKAKKQLLQSNDKSSLEQFRKECYVKICNLSYEESLRELDMLLDTMQESDLQVEDLQRSYIKGNIYLEHCQELLDQVEQDVIEINEEKINELNNHS